MQSAQQALDHCIKMGEAVQANQSQFVNGPQVQNWIHQSMIALKVASCEKHNLAMEFFEYCSENMVSSPRDQLQGCLEKLRSMRDAAGE